MEQSLVTSSARTWNQKNFPSDLERLERSSRRTAKRVRQLPSAAAAFVRRPQGMATLSLAILGALGLVWLLSKGD